MAFDFSKVLVTGGGGMVGSYVDFGIKTDRRSLDVTDLKETVSVVEKYKPRAILHLAAETDVDRCERDPEYAYIANSVGTFNVAMAAKEVGAKVVYVSTVYVFDGSKKDPYSEEDTPSPRSYYGMSKYLGELAVRGVLDNFLIVRAGWMFGGGPTKDQKFVAKIIKQLEDSKEIKVVRGDLGSLTYARDLVYGIKDMLSNDKRGIVHAFNSGFCSRYDIASEIKKIAGSQVGMIPVEPGYFGLDVSRNRSDTMASMHGGGMRPWQEALKEYWGTEWKNQHSSCTINE